MCDQHEVLSRLACVVKDAEASQTTHLEMLLRVGFYVGYTWNDMAPRVERFLFGHVEVISTQAS